MDPEQQAAAEAAAKAKADADATAAAEAAKKADEAAAADEVARLKAEVAELQKRTKDFEGIDPSIAREALAKAEAAEAAAREAEKAKAVAEGNWEKVRELMANEHVSVVEKKNAEIRELQERLTVTEQMQQRAAIQIAFSNSEFVTKKMALPVAKTQQLYAEHVEIENGKPVVYSAPRGDSDRVKLVDAKGQPLSFDVAFEKVIMADPDKDRLLAADVKAGAGSRSDDRKTAPEVKSRHERIAEGIASLRRPGAA